MPRNEDGEFELIMGNRQLLSVFFIIVILLGVFFTMGYIVGRNSAPLTEIAASPKQESKPIVVEQVAKPPAVKTEAPAPSAAPTETAPQQPPSSSESKSEPKAEPKSEPPTKKEEPKKAESKAPPKSVSAGTVSEPVAGATYLQLIASDRDTCEIAVDQLRKKKFPAMASSIPEKSGWYRVLVGPIEPNAVNKTKKDLQDAGFPGNQAIRKKF